MSRDPGPDPFDVLGSLDLTTTMDNKGLWLPLVAHVPALSARFTLELERALTQIDGPGTGRNPKGLVIRGPAGSGKTHTIGYAHFRVRHMRGYFVVVPLHADREFWVDVRDGFLGSLLRDGQLRSFLGDLARSLGMNSHQVLAISGEAVPSLNDLDALVTSILRRDRTVGAQVANVARALVLYASDDLKLHTAGRDYFAMSPGSEETLQRVGLHTLPDNAQVLVGQLSLLISQIGPTVFAIDQVDGLLQRSRTTDSDVHRRQETRSHGQVIDEVAQGLMALREETHRSVTILACSPATWNDLDSNAIDSMRDRFIVPKSLGQIPSEQAAHDLVRTRFSAHYSLKNFQPPYSTWPVDPVVFAQATRYTPRRLLERIEKHLGDCVERQTIVELRDLTDDSVEWPGEPRKLTAADQAPQAPAERWSDVDQLWDQLIKSADPEPLMDPLGEDKLAPTLFTTALQTWALEQRTADGYEYRCRAGTGRPPNLHGTVQRIAGEGGSPQWSFRMLGAEHHKAVLARLRVAIEAARLGAGGHLVILRRKDSWPGGPNSVTQGKKREFLAAGGINAELSPGDARLLLALQALYEANPPDLEDWITSRRPAQNIDVFQKYLPGGGNDHHPGTDPEPPDSPPTNTEPLSPQQASSTVGSDSETANGTESNEEADPEVTLGRIRRDGQPFSISLRTLRKHVLIVAGSGSGKTVLLKRLVEEVALQGVSSVVLDPNNDLSRMGLPWPQPPQSWTEQDARSADAYFEEAEVLVWTPRRSAGRPLRFDPIPDLAAFGADPDEFDGAVEAAVAALAPRAGLRGATPRALVSLAVLTESLKFFGRSGARGIDGLIKLLDDLPEEATTFDDGRTLARAMATALRAAQVTDPLFAAGAASTDPRELLTPSPGKRARISIVNFIGLQQVEQRQTFVSQLQLALFAQFRRNPSRAHLGGLLVMDEAQNFVPAQGTTASTASTLQLASQARKFGLGVAFATQAPRGLHNQVSGNTATQFFGRLSAPTQIKAAESLAQSRGGAVPEIARLTAGQFFASTEGMAPTRITAPMSLSHHPDGPPAEDEILQLARRAPLPGSPATG